MDRITKEQREKFHALLDQSLTKLETPKNRMKPDWSTLSEAELIMMILIETHELQLAAINGSVKSKDSEANDIINLTMMYKDNLYNGLY